MRVLLIRTGPSGDLPELYSLLLLNSSSAIVAVGTILKQFGVDVDYWHIPIMLGIPRTQEKYNERLGKFRMLIKGSYYDWIGFSCISCDEYLNILDFARICKEEKPDTMTVMGGYHATMVARNIMRDSKYIDVVVRGDFEPICEKFIKGIKNHEQLKYVPNLILRHNGKIIETQKMLIKYNINTLPSYDFSIVEKYVSSLGTLDIEGSRGCKFKCEYCSEAVVRGGHFWSVKKPEKLIEGMKTYSSFMDEHFSYRRFFFVDPLFGVDKNWLNDFCNRLIESNLNLVWSCEMRLDRLNSDEILLMRKAGCTFIFHGFESGSPRMLRLMRKTNTPEKYLKKALEIVNTARKHDLYIFGSYMLGYPGETMNSLQETRDFIEKQIDAGGEYFYPSLVFFMPYPGTSTYFELDKFSKRYGTKVLIDNLWKYSKTCLHRPIIQPSKELDVGSLVEFHSNLHQWAKSRTYNERMARTIGAPTNIDFNADLIELRKTGCLPPAGSVA
ncbi:MAG: B12-binding domain-containing radical SAM protein [Thermoplasmatales archaeon]|nr:MAG: B12-binding domain-containing radical SAM protein [Thermoplasmatales archaeon]